jgi:syndecan 1
MTADGGDRSFGAPRFDVVLRGYDRRQVDEHLSRLQRLMGRMRSDLDAARTQQAPPIGPPTPASGRPRPTPRPRPDGSPPTGGNDVVGTFTDRMHAILQAAEEEAAEIRNKARAAAKADDEWAAGLRAATRAEEEAARKTVADLVRQRDAVLAELTRVRGQLEGLLSGPTTRITLPTQESGPDRREVGAGQPLPGTPHSPEPEPVSETVAVTVGPPSTPSAPHDAVGPAARTAAGTAVFAVPVGAGEPSSDEPDEPAAERTTPGIPAAVSPAAVSPAEETAVMEPLTDEPEESAPAVESGPVEFDAVESGAVESDAVESGPVEPTQAYGAGEGGGAAADEPDDDSGPPAEAPTPLHSQAR